MIYSGIPAVTHCGILFFQWRKVAYYFKLVRGVFEVLITLLLMNCPLGLAVAKPNRHSFYYLLPYGRIYTRFYITFYILVSTSETFVPLKHVI